MPAFAGVTVIDCNTATPEPLSADVWLLANPVLLSV
jgi:hypothetical protein